MAYKRQNVNGTSPLDLKAMNDNFMALWDKVFGDINMSDIQKDVKDVLYTAYLSIQGEGNIDSSHPIYIRFYIPPNVKKINSAKLNIITSRYRVDSDVTSSSPAKTSSSTVTSGASSISTSESGGGYTSTRTSSSGGGGTVTSVVNDWVDGGGAYAVPAPSSYGVNDFLADLVNTQAGEYAKIDYYRLNHNHHVYIPNHNHSVSIDIPEHSHNMAHTHKINMTFEIPEHSHSLNMGIKEANVAPQNVKCYVNDKDIGINLSGDFRTSNDVDILDSLTIGGWNILKFSSSNIARITCYGVIEILQDY